MSCASGVCRRTAAVKGQVLPALQLAGVPPSGPAGLHPAADEEGTPSTAQ